MTYCGSKNLELEFDSLAPRVFVPLSQRNYNGVLSKCWALEAIRPARRSGPPMVSDPNGDDMTAVIIKSALH
jgi:hypothetical protein